MDRKLRIMIVEDYEPFRRYLSSRLQKLGEMEVVFETGDGAEAVATAKNLQPDLALVDVVLANAVNGIEAATGILRVAPNTKILFISQESSAEVVEAALSTGAGGYLLKSDSEPELMDAIESVLQGGEFRSTSISSSRKPANSAHANEV